MHGLHLEKLPERVMTNETKALLLHIEEELEGLNTDLKFEHDDESVSFNLYDNTSDAGKVRMLHTFATNETTYLVDGADIDAMDTAVVYTNDNRDYIVVVDKHLEIPLMYIPGINYLVVPNHDFLQTHIEVINNFSVCLTTIDDFAESNPDITTKVIRLDNPTYNVKTTASASLFDIAIASEKEGRNGVDAINKYIHSSFKSVSIVDDIVPKGTEDIPLVTPRTEKSSVPVSTIPDEAKVITNRQTTRSINLAELIVDSKYQLRVAEDISAIKDLVIAYQDGDSVPAIEVIDIGDKNLLVDGFHRVAAAKEAGLDSIECEVTVGTERDAFIISLGANANNKALKRTNADKRKAVQSALNDEIFKDLSSREIASICRVSHTIVNRIKSELLENGNISTLDIDAVAEEIETETVSTDAVPSKPILEDKTGNVSTSPKTSKPYKKTLSFDGDSVVLNIQSVVNENALNELLADLNGAVDSYMSMLEEVNK